MKTLLVGLTILFVASPAFANYACPGAQSHCDAPSDYACFNFDGYNDPNDKSSLRSSVANAWVKGGSFCVDVSGNQNPPQALGFFKKHCKKLVKC